ncbi:hypothetical protein DER44DRAFT_665695, partial [Fusarium oxysporum]
PWLIYTRFPMHLQGLYNTKIILSYILPRSIDDDNNNSSNNNNNNNNREEEGSIGNIDIDLRHILTAAKSILRDIYKLYSNKSPNCKIMQQYAKRLSNFRSNNSNISSIKASKFYSFKNKLSLTSYF